MKRRFYILYLFPLLLLQGCFVADNFFIEAEPSAEKSLQTKAEEAVQNFIKKDLEGEKYVPYGYSALKIVKPVELIAIDSLELDAVRNPTDTLLKRKINALKKEVYQKGIRREIKIDHFFTLQTDSARLTIIENQYTLNDSVIVMASKPKIILDLPLVYEGILNYYFNEHTIFISNSYANSRLLSLEFYAYFKKEIDQLPSIQEKSALLKNTLNICSIVKKTGEFDQAYTLRLLYEDYIRNERTDISDFKPLFYSDLYETMSNIDSATTGYYFYHKFSGIYNDSFDTTSVQLNFNPYYQLTHIMPLEMPVEFYLKNLE